MVNQPPTQPMGQPRAHPRMVAVTALGLALIAAVLCGWAALNEWQYYQDHPFRRGVSGVLTVLGLGCTLVCLAVAALAWDRLWSRRAGG